MLLERIRTLMVVLEEGSVSRAAARLRMTQPALSRQMKALENELGGRLLERQTSGVKPTGFCHEVLARMRPVLVAYDQALSDLKKQARAGKSELRIGYLISAAEPLLTPALAALRKSYPQVTLRLHDMSPREQIEALRAGEIDVALAGQEGSVAARDFYARKLCSIGVCAALSLSDPLSENTSLKLGAFRKKEFIGVDETEVPGRNQWIAALCRTAGFKPRFLTSCDGIHNVLSLVVSESATTFLPGYFRDFRHPGVTFIPIADPWATWDFIVLWQRGKPSREVRALVDALAETAKKVWG